VFLESRDFPERREILEQWDQWDPWDHKERKVMASVMSSKSIIRKKKQFNEFIYVFYLISDIH
jgi:hypothetical protein